MEASYWSFCSFSRRPPSCPAVFVAADIVLCYTLPLMREVLDTPDPQNLGAKLVFLAVSVAVYAAGTLLALRISQRRLEAQDIR